MRVSVEGGKYTYVITETNAHVLRYGEMWKDATGDKFTYSMAAEIEALREQVEKLKNRLNKDSQEFTILCAKETEKVLREQVEFWQKEAAGRRDDMANYTRIASETIDRLNVEVEKLKAELKSIDGALNDPRANLTLTTSEIIWELKEQVSKLTKERDIKEHCIVQLEAEDLRMKEQLAALAEQNERLKDALKTVVDDAEECTDHDDWTAMLLSLDAYHIASTCIEEINELHDLATPVLNRIKAETLEAFKVELMYLVANGEASISETSVAVDALETRVDKLTNKEKGEVK